MGKGNQAILALVSRFVLDIESVIQGEVKEAISSVLRPAKSSNGVAPTLKKKRGRPAHVSADKRSPKQMEAMRAKLVAFAMRTPGQRSEDIQKALKLEPEDIALPLRQLLNAKILRCEGNARGRRYWAVSSANA